MSFVTMATAKQVLIASYKHRQPVMLTGKPGIGKTAMVEAACSELGIGFIDFRGSTRDIADIGGMRVPDEKTGKMRWYAPSDLPDEKVHGKQGIMFFDEINAMPLSHQVAVYGIMQERRIGDWRAPAGWSFAAAGNSIQDRAGAQRMSTALANRMRHVFVKEDLDVWIKQYAAEHVDPRGVAFLKLRPELFHVMPTADQLAFPSPRSWTNAFACLDDDADTRLHMWAGSVGDGAAAELSSFMELYESLGGVVDDIINDPDNATLPSDSKPNIQYAVSAACAKIMSRKNIKNVVRYLDRLPEEYSVFAMRHAVKRDKTLCNTAVYSQWEISHQGVTL